MEKVSTQKNSDIGDFKFILFFNTLNPYFMVPYNVSSYFGFFVRFCRFVTNLPTDKLYPVRINYVGLICHIVQKLVGRPIWFHRGVRNS